MIIRRETLQAVLPATSDDPSRYVLNAISVEPDGTVVATDGHLLLCAKERRPMDDADFPTRDLPAYKANADKPISLAVDLVRKLIGAMPKATKRALPVLQTIQLAQSETGTYVAATDLETVMVKQLDLAEQPIFPKWQQVQVPKDRPALKVVLAVALLEDLIKAAKAAGMPGGGRQLQTITFYVPTEAKYQGTLRQPSDTGVKGKPDRQIMHGLRIEFQGSDVDVEGVAMPCRV